ncbi:unnamed protein product [Hermetia illucens]|uniref:Neurotransmitter-gated ion-channel ligand-binding domain-containing protein n=1 Tax=Hermetia illucens TaxID=343691 RepID=A0A7R8YVZ0_HERIL|nr:unnamed protein product [Hermetia illucens]
MEMETYLITLLIFLLGINESTQGPHEKRLLNHLLATYNTLERPVANESEPLEVKFGLTLQQIIDVEWNDYNLRWNDSEYGGVKDLRITPNKLWKPDVLMYNRILFLVDVYVAHVRNSVVSRFINIVFTYIFMLQSWE